MTKRILEINSIKKYIDGIIVSDGVEHEKEIEGVPVKCISEYNNLDKCHIVNTLTRWEIRTDVDTMLRAMGVENSILNLLNYDQLFDFINAIEPGFFMG